jgi:hypothetical protein
MITIIERHCLLATFRVFYGISRCVYIALSLAHLLETIFKDINSIIYTMPNGQAGGGTGIAAYFNNIVIIDRRFEKYSQGGHS